MIKVDAGEREESQVPMGMAPEGAGGGDGAVLAGLEAPGEVRRRRVSGSTVLVAVVLVVAGGVLFGMRQIGLGPKSAAAAGKTKLEVPEPSAVSKVDHRAVLADLTASRTEHQVPKEQVKKNPFVLAVVTGTTEVPVGDYADREAAEARRAAEEAKAKAKAAREQVIVQALGQLQLHGVMGGSSPVARINQKLYRVGDVVAEHFVLRAIHGRSVELEADGRVAQLEMSDGGR